MKYPVSLLHLAEINTAEIKSEQEQLVMNHDTVFIRVNMGFIILI